MWEFDSLIPNHRSSKVAADFFSGCSAVGSALGSGPRGRGFESRHSDHKKLFHRLVKELFVFSRSDGIRTARSRHSGTQTVQWTVCEGAGESAPVCRIKVVFFSIFSILCSYGSTSRQLPHKKRLDKTRAFQPGILSSHCFF